MRDDLENAFFALLGAAALAALALTRGPSLSPTSAAETDYRTSCSIVESQSLDGFVSNLSGNAYQARGEARFRFVQSGSISRPEIVIQINAMVPSGETVRVARTHLAFLPRPGELCVFDVSGAMRRTE